MVLSQQGIPFYTLATLCENTFNLQTFKSREMTILAQLVVEIGSQGRKAVLLGTCACLFFNPVHILLILLKIVLFPDQKKQHITV